MVQEIVGTLGWFCVHVMAALSYLGVAILMGIESACIPLPSELIMPYAGAMSHPDVAAALQVQYGVDVPAFNLLLAAIAGALGCNLGSEVAYWVGAKGGRPAIERYGRYLLISKHELDLGDRWFAKRGEIIILLARMLPVVRTFIAFPAGVARMNRAKFHAYTFIGSLPWCLAARLRRPAARAQAARGAFAAQELHAPVRRGHRPRHHRRRRLFRVVALQGLPSVQAGRCGGALQSRLRRAAVCG